MVHTHTHTHVLIIYILYIYSIKTHFAFNESILCSCYYGCLSTWRNIRLQGYPFRHKEIYGHQTADHKTIFIFLSLTFLSCTSLSHICDSPFLLLLPFIYLDLYVSSLNYDCIQYIGFNFTDFILPKSF
jgi:hypothetical protein